MDEESDVAWAAGLFEGEGSISIRHKRPICQLKMTDGEMVTRFQKVVNCGRVYGPYGNRMGEKDGYPRKDVYQWTASSGDCERVIKMFWPWLSAYRRQRAREVGFSCSFT